MWLGAYACTHERTHARTGAHTCACAGRISDVPEWFHVHTQTHEGTHTHERTRAHTYKHQALDIAECVLQSVCTRADAYTLMDSKQFST